MSARAQLERDAAVEAAVDTCVAHVTYVTSRRRSQATGAPSASATGYDESDSFGPLEPRQCSELRPEQHNDDDDGVEEEEEEEEVTEC